MINYSIVMRSVNANLLEINQAKSRINQAKKDGKEPEKKDTDLVKTEKQNAFAISQYTDVMTIEKFAKHITSHGSVYSRADISAILYMAVDCMREMLLEGKKIRLGDLGDFSLLLSSKGTETADKFTAQNITNVKVQWEPGQQFKNLLDDAEFNLVASRSAQAAVIKAIKEGKTNVDLNVPVTPDGGGDGTTGGGTQDGGSGTTGTEGSGTTGNQGTSGGNIGGASDTHAHYSVDLPPRGRQDQRHGDILGGCGRGQKERVRAHIPDSGFAPAVSANHRGCHLFLQRQHQPVHIQFHRLFHAILRGTA